jgi:hypothetical protein
MSTTANRNYKGANVFTAPFAVDLIQNLACLPIFCSLNGARAGRRPVQKIPLGKASNLASAEKVGQFDTADYLYFVASFLLPLAGNLFELVKILTVFI